MESESNILPLHIACTACWDGPCFVFDTIAWVPPIAIQSVLSKVVEWHQTLTLHEPCMPFLIRGGLTCRVQTSFTTLGPFFHIALRDG